jgi:hypothetical protein
MAHPDAMRRKLAFALALGLAACADSPSPRFTGVDPVPVTLDGRDYRVWARPQGRGGEVQVVRLGYARRGAHDPLVPAMIAAAEQVTGCTVARATVSGDTGVINARYRC